MTKKDYQLIADALALGFDGANVTIEQARGIITRFAEALRTTNPRFDAKRFFEACIRGVDFKP